VRLAAVAYPLNLLGYDVCYRGIDFIAASVVKAIGGERTRRVSVSGLAVEILPFLDVVVCCSSGTLTGDNER
jgi:hypothetical protein